MAKLYQVSSPKCNNKKTFIALEKDKYGHQKYLCKKCKNQWALDTPKGDPDHPKTKNIPISQSVEKLFSCTMTESITVTTATVTKNATIFCPFKAEWEQTKV